MSLIRARQPVVTRLNPHAGNRRFMHIPPKTQQAPPATLTETYVTFDGTTDGLTRAVSGYGSIESFKLVAHFKLAAPEPVALARAFIFGAGTSTQLWRIQYNATGTFGIGSNVNQVITNLTYLSDGTGTGNQGQVNPTIKIIYSGETLALNPTESRCWIWVFVNGTLVELLPIFSAIFPLDFSTCDGIGIGRNPPAFASPQFWAEQIGQIRVWDTTASAGIGFTGPIRNPGPTSTNTSADTIIGNPTISVLDTSNVNVGSVCSLGVTSIDYYLVASKTASTITFNTPLRTLYLSGVEVIPWPAWTQSQDMTDALSETPLTTGALNGIVPDIFVCGSAADWNAGLNRGSGVCGTPFTVSGSFP